MEHYINSLGLGFNITGGVGVFLTTLVLVLLAEMGDKTQLLVMAFSTRYKIRQVIIGVGLSIVILNLIAVLMGSIITTLVPTRYIQFLASIVFIIFGIMAFRKDNDEEEKEKTFKINPTLAIAASFFVAELGDKTQLATMAFAAQFKMPLQVFLGAVIAMVIADSIGLIAGVAINRYISPAKIKILSGVLFIGFGIIGLGSMMPQEQLSAIIQSTVFMIGLGAILIMFMLVLAKRVKD